MSIETTPTARSDRRPPSRRGVLAAAGVGTLATAAVAVGPQDDAVASEAEHVTGADNFHTSDRVTVRRVTFLNQYDMTLAGNLFTPVDLPEDAAAPALVVGHPMGAVKEQSANLYATKMAERGYVTMSFDLPFWGESDGWPRQSVSPDLYAEAFSAAVDFLGTRAPVDRGRIGAIGVCGSGGFVLSAAKLDPRMRAIATVSMYDMGGLHRDGLDGTQSAQARQSWLADAAEQRYAQVDGDDVEWGYGTPLELTADSTDIEREFFDFYRTPRGEFTPAGASPDRTTMRPITQEARFANFHPFDDLETISSRPLLFVAGDQAHSRRFSEDAYRRAAEPKTLHWVRGAGHVDLYDRVDLIPFDLLGEFFDQHLAG
ncbi:alpha/beta hydrolase [Kineococcus sp. NBC_00420]|uniref:alpha/beta hydrolase n=1 Tax=unclassified Kineococcus TaxID=2621656 RepID=UPI002E21358C